MSGSMKLLAIHSFAIRSSAGTSVTFNTRLQQNLSEVRLSNHLLLCPFLHCRPSRINLPSVPSADLPSIISLRQPYPTLPYSLVADSLSCPSSMPTTINNSVCLCIFPDKRGHYARPDLTFQQSVCPFNPSDYAPFQHSPSVQPSYIPSLLFRKMRNRPNPPPLSVAISFHLSTHISSVQ